MPIIILSSLFAIFDILIFGGFGMFANTYFKNIQYKNFYQPTFISSTDYSTRNCQITENYSQYSKCQINIYKSGLNNSDCRNWDLELNKRKIYNTSCDVANGVFSYTVTLRNFNFFKYINLN